MKKVFNLIVYTFALIGFVLVSVYASVELGLTNSKGIVDKQHDYFQQNTQEWSLSDEWTALKPAIRRDAPLIHRVSGELGISSRLLVSMLVVEQMRLFNSEREIFKKVFAPLEILGNQSQFSWGVMGIKQDTAKIVEQNLKDTTSPFYLGSEYEHKLDFKTNDPDNERFERMTDDKDRYYSYLYAGILIKQLLKQWENAGYPIDKRPEIVATLYNIGFKNSKPKGNPEIGGAEIEINKTTYSFGGFAQSFFYSNELLENFPR